MNHSRLERLFSEASKKLPGPERSALVNEACGDDGELKQQLEGLLAAHEQPTSFFDVEQYAEQRPAEETPKSDKQIGDYKLLQVIGEGGFGQVFMADQLRPVKRKVALKLIKPGMDSKAVIARFEAERQALAMMDHANIARVFDGGTTEQGHPYFVMELVKGVPITEYCDANQLTTMERLRLFLDICDAVQHAHQKGIIHRDLKPNNIMVTLHDGQPVVKVIDFGVAKAINQQLTEKTLFTAYGQMVGTPQYMSPEQAEISGLDIDTRSDIYSLGVVLYELLTASTPLEEASLRAAGFVELQRLIRESVPPKPSNRLSSSGDKLTIIAKHRNVSSEQLHRTVSGDLDWIVMKSLEKDRTRRYGSALELRNDVSRYIDQEPIEARPPSNLYLAKMFFRRHRSLALGTTAILVSLLVGLSAAILALNEAVAQSAQKDQALISLRDVLFDHGVNHAQMRNFNQATRVVEQLDLIPNSKHQSDLLSAFLAMSDERHQDAVNLLLPLVEKNGESSAARGLLTYAHEGTGDLESFWHSHHILDSLEPQTAEDFYFKGMPYGIDPKLGVELLSKAIELRRSPVFHLMRGRMYADWALQSGEIDKLPEALSDVEQASAWLGYEGNAGTEALRTYVCLLYAAKAAGSQQQYETMRSKAKEVADSIGEDRERGFWNPLFAGNLEYELGNKRESLHIFERAGRRGMELCYQSYLLLAYELDVTPAEDLLSEEFATDYCITGRLCYYCLLGDEEKANAEAARLLSSADSVDALLAVPRASLWFGRNPDRVLSEVDSRWDHFPATPWDRWAHANFLTFQKTLDASHLAESVESSDYRGRHQTYASTWLAVRHMSKDQIENARESFRDCYDQHLLYNGLYFMARAALTRHPDLKMANFPE